MKGGFKSKFYRLAFCMAAALVFHISRAEATEVNWTEINPEFADATYVNDTAKCFECPEDYMATFNKTRHGRTFKSGAQNELQARGWGACHGPMRKNLPPTHKATTHIDYNKQ